MLPLSLVLQWVYTGFMVLILHVLQWVYGLHRVIITCFTVGVRASLCYYHLFYSGSMGFKVSLSLVLQWVYGLNVPGHNIHGVIITCFIVDA